MGGGSLVFLLFCVLSPLLAITRSSVLPWAVFLNVTVFLLSRIPRWKIVLRWPKMMRPIQRLQYVVLTIVIVLMWAKYTREAVWIAMPIACGLHGLLFWAVSDDMFELWTWLVRSFSITP